jgi:hypothetical protein
MGSWRGGGRGRSDSLGGSGVGARPEVRGEREPARPERAACWVEQVSGPAGQNEDGFYRISSDTGVAVFVVDLGTGTTFGPFPSGTVVKYTQSPGATPARRRSGVTTSRPARWNCTFKVRGTSAPPTAASCNASFHLRRSSGAWHFG